MKRYFCIFLMSWLPLFMASASAMSMQMAFASNHAAILQSSSHMPCHEDVSKHPPSQNQKHFCMVCGFCVIANGVVINNTVPEFHMHQVASTKSVFVDVVFYSLQHPPAIKPPIFS
jgi:hypothetical protein